MDGVSERSPSGTGTRMDPMSGSLPMISLNVVWVVAVTAASGWLSRQVGSGWHELVAYSAIAGIALFLGTALPLRHFLLAQRRVSHQRESLLSEESSRRRFEGQLTRALDMSADQATALLIASEALQLLAPDSAIEILLADSSRAHLTSSSSEADRHCHVQSPNGCAAVRSGHAITFDDSSALDACPHLRNRSARNLSAVCVPVSIMGSATGVVHLVRDGDGQFGVTDATSISGVAQQLGSRLGLISAMAQSELQANTDPLTGLLNRRSLENKVRTLIGFGRRFTVVLVDLDHFKDLNDTHGHDAGDRALRVFAQVVRSAMRDGDFACRYGGEEFVLVMPDASADDAVRAVDRLRMELHASFTDGRTPPFTFSAGVADNSTNLDLAKLITIADHALLEAKRSGRNRTISVTAPAIG